jgi:TrpR-related protein YerC/YecD
MPKRKENWDFAKNNQLFEAIVSLRTNAECAKFFRDLCTTEEITDMADRWQMVKMLLKGMTYRDIAQKLNVSSTTVARVASWYDGGKGGYQLVAKRLKLDKND